MDTDRQVAAWCVRSLGRDCPERTLRARPPAKELASRLRTEDVRGVVLAYVDTAGITRIKAVPLRRLPTSAAWGVGIPPVFDTFLSDDSITSTDRLVPAR